MSIDRYMPHLQEELDVDQALSRLGEMPALPWAEHEDC